MDFSAFEGSSVLVTGATGLIGCAIVKSLLQHQGDHPVQVIAAVRNQKKAERLFAVLPQDHLDYIVSDIREFPLYNLGVDYLIHAACETASMDFIHQPVEVMETSIQGTKRMLEFARLNPLKGFVYLSSLETYGCVSVEEKVKEDAPSYLNAMSPRSSYPESKRLCECLCASYAAEYGVPARVVRLTQTFGPGVAYNNPHVYAEFARCALEGRDIVLHTKGETKRSYLYTEDAVDAILTVLASGADGEAYNAANEETYCSIFEMASMVAEKFGAGRCRVIIDDRGDAQKYGYAPTLKTNLSCEKLCALGWSPRVDLEQSFAGMIADMKA